MSVGYSSHVLNPYIVAATVWFHVETIEVHFDLADQQGVESGHSYTPDMLQQLVQLTREFKTALDCNCEQTFGDFNAVSFARRDPSDWLRPPLPND